MSVDLPVIESCSGCGACCLEQESPPMYLFWLLSPVRADNEDSLRVRALPDELKAELLSYRDRLVAKQGHPNNKVCLWFDEKTRGCKHYDLRPSICREFERGSSDCHRWREKYGIDQ